MGKLIMKESKESLQSQLADIKKNKEEMESEFAKDPNIKNAYAVFTVDLAKRAYEKCIKLLNDVGDDATDTEKTEIHREIIQILSSEIPHMLPDSDEEEIHKKVRKGFATGFYYGEKTVTIKKLRKSIGEEIKEET